MDSLIEYAMKHCKDSNIVKSGERVLVVIGGKIEGQVSSNQLKIYNVVWLTTRWTKICLIST